MVRAAILHWPYFKIMNQCELPVGNLASLLKFVDLPFTDCDLPWLMLAYPRVTILVDLMVVTTVDGRNPTQPPQPYIGQCISCTPVPPSSMLNDMLTGGAGFPSLAQIHFDHCVCVFKQC